MQARCTATVAAGVVLFVLNHCVADDVARDADHSGRGRAASADGWRPVNKRAESENSRAEIRKGIGSKASDSSLSDPDSLPSFDSRSPTAGTQKLSTLNSPPSQYFVAAQSPEDDRYARGGPDWTYPARRSAATAPVPDYRGESDYSSRSPQYDTRLAQTPRRDDWYARGTPPPPRDAGSSSGGYGDYGPRRGDAAATATPFPGAPRPRAPAVSQYDDPPARGSYQQPYHSAPFDNAGPSCPTDPYAPNPYAPPTQCAPCQPPPPVAFGDPCDPSNFYNCRYTWNAGYLFGVADAFRFDGDDTRCGGRLGINWGLPLVDDDTGIGIQAGYSGGVAEGGGQQFFTGGIFYRGDMRYGAAFNIGGVVDWMQDNAYETDLWQVRPKASVTLDPHNELGVWGAVNVRKDDKSTGETIKSVNQANLFYRALLPGGIDIAPFVGWRGDPSGPALGADLYVPLSDFWGFMAGGYYAFKGDTWDAFAGLVLHWGPRARQDFIGQDRHMPYLPVADNTSMTLSLDR